MLHLCLILVPSWGLSIFPQQILKTNTYNLNTKSYISYQEFTCEYPRNRSKIRMIEKYGKGAEIFPLTNQYPIQLTDSFPDGILPYPIEENNKSNPLHQNNQKRKNLFDDSPLGWIISSNTKYGDGILLTFAILVVVAGFVRPMDLFTVACISGYVVILSILASSPKLENGDKSRNYSSNLPALPPQGHIPSMFTHPLGYVFTYSDSYRLWLKVGATLGFVVPGIVIVYYSIIQGEWTLAATVARPFFLICCQSIHENILRRDIVRFEISLVLCYIDLYFDKTPRLHILCFCF